MADDKKTGFIEKANGEMGTFIFRSMITLIMSGGIAFIVWTSTELSDQAVDAQKMRTEAAEDNAKAAADRAAIAQALAVVATEMESLEANMSDRFTGKDAANMSKQINNRVTYIAQSQSEMIKDLKERVVALERTNVRQN